MLGYSQCKFLSRSKQKCLTACTQQETTCESKLCCRWGLTQKQHIAADLKETMEILRKNDSEFTVKVRFIVKAEKQIILVTDSSKVFYLWS